MYDPLVPARKPYQLSYNRLGSLSLTWKFSTHYCSITACGHCLIHEIKGIHSSEQQYLFHENNTLPTEQQLSGLFISDLEIFNTLLLHNDMQPPLNPWDQWMSKQWRTIPLSWKEAKNFQTSLVSTFISRASSLSCYNNEFAYQRKNECINLIWNQVKSRKNIWIFVL